MLVQLQAKTLMQNSSVTLVFPLRLELREFVLQFCAGLLHDFWRSKRTLACPRPSI
jgi:hypothetical protein